jgi:sugar/nucleoside kinase (ribokinase family)
LVADTFVGPLAALPREGELLALDGFPVTPGGCAANVAIGLSKQQIAVDVVGCVGRDASAQVVLSSLQAHHVGCAMIREVDHLPTSQTIVLLVKGQDRRYLHVFGANRALAVDHIDREWVRGLKVFYLGGLFVLPGIDLAALGDLFRFCRDSGVLTVLDVVVPQSASAASSASAAQDFGGLRDVLPHTDYFLPNDDEAERLTGHADPGGQARALRDLGAKTVVITQGASGFCAAYGDQLWQAGAFRVDAVDLSGGGDAFAAGLIAGLVRGQSFVECLRYASVLGASATLAVGTTTGVFTTLQANAFLQNHTLPITQTTL